MRHVTGIVLFAIAFLLIRAALERRDRSRRAAATAPPLHPSLAGMGEIVTPIILFGLLVAGGQMVLAFWATDGGGVFSLFDLAGFIVLLVAYGVWVRTKTRYRLPASHRY